MSGLTILTRYFAQIHRLFDIYLSLPFASQWILDLKKLEWALISGDPWVQDQHSFLATGSTRFPSHMPYRKVCSLLLVLMDPFLS